MTTLLLTASEWATRMQNPLRDHSYQQTKLGPAIVEYLAWKKLSGAAARTLEDYERDLARVALSVDMELAQVGSEDMLLALGLWPHASQRRAHSVLSDFFKWGLVWDRLPRNPMDRIPRPKKVPPRVHDIFTTGEQGKLVTAAGLTLAPYVDRLRVLLLLDTGARSAEARRLQVRDANLSDRYVILHGKGDKERLVPLRGDVVRAFEQFLLWPIPGLHRAPEPEDHIWMPMPATGAYGAREAGILVAYPQREMSRRGFSEWWGRIMAASGVRYRKPHMTRHTYATNLVDADVNLKDVQELLGHSSTATTEIYVHSSRKRLEGAVEKLMEGRGKR